MNQAMLAKQYWKLIQNPNSLLARTLKSKFYPNCSLQEITTKPHHPWFWRSILNAGNVLLKDGKWLIGRGQNISLTDQYWFKSNFDSLSRFGLQNGTVADLLDRSSYSGNFDLIRAIYCHAQWSDIMAILYLKLLLLVTSWYGNIQLMVSIKLGQPIVWYYLS